MATRKGIHISRNYVVHHKLYAFFIYQGMYFVFYKIKRSDRIVSYQYIVFKTQRPSDTVF